MPPSDNVEFGSQDPETPNFQGGDLLSLVWARGLLGAQAPALPWNGTAVHIGPADVNIT